MRLTSKAWLLMFLAATALSCSESRQTPSAPSSPMMAATPPSMSQSPMGPLSSLADPDTRLFNVTGADTAPGGRGPCEYSPSTGQFVCQDQTRDGITFTMRYTLYDASGKAQSAFDRNTASIKTETTAEGTTARDNGTTATINRRGTMTTTGLGPAATSHTLNGSEHGTVETTATAKDGTKVTTRSTIDSTTTNLVVPVRSGDRGSAYPLSGVRVHTTVTTGPQSRGAVTVRRQETFDGTSVVRVELTVNGVTQQCSFDLATKTSTCHR